MWQVKVAPRPAVREAIVVSLPTASVRRCPETGWLDCFIGTAEREFRYCRSAIDATEKVAIHYLPADCEAISKLHRPPEGVPARLWQTVLKEARALQFRR